MKRLRDTSVDVWLAIGGGIVLLGVGVYFLTKPAATAPAATGAGALPRGVAAPGPAAPAAIPMVYTVRLSS